MKRTSSAGRPRQHHFVIVGTIEPRKNHLLLLNLWRDIASGAASSPKLVAIGARGWENEQVCDMFERCAAIRPHLMKVEQVGAAALAQLVADAQALLMPSFDEGYGLPIVEALTLGTAVTASDIPVFREITQGCATLLSPLNGQAWRDTILAFCKPQSSALNAARAKAAQFSGLLMPRAWEFQAEGSQWLSGALPVLAKILPNQLHPIEIATRSKRSSALGAVHWERFADGLLIAKQNSGQLAGFQDEGATSSFSIFLSVPGERRRRYAPIHKTEQNFMCQ